MRFRASVPPARTLEFIKRAELSEFAADPAFGIVVGSCPPDRKRLLREIVTAFSGVVIFDDAEDRETLFGASHGQLQLLQRLQSAFEQ